MREVVHPTGNPSPTAPRLRRSEEVSGRTSFMNRQGRSVAARLHERGRDWNTNPNIVYLIVAKL